MRFSFPFGPHSRRAAARLGVWNQFIERAAMGETLRIYGNGEQLRDVVYIDDAVHALLAIGANDSCVGEVFNYGGERPLRLCDAVEVIAREAGGTPVEHVPWPENAQKVETGDYCSDLSKIKRYVSLPPQCDFAEGVRRTIAAIRAEAGAAGRQVGAAAPAPSDTTPRGHAFGGKRALVVGGSGYLGSHLVRRLLGEGAKVTAVSRTMGRLEALRESDAFDFKPADLLDREDLDAIVRLAAPDLVFFTAAWPDGDESLDAIWKRADVGVRGLLNLLEAMRCHAPDGHIVYADSRKVYGNVPGPHNSRTMAGPLSSYAIVKHTGWSLCELYARLHGMHVVSVRPSLIYGPGQGRNLFQVVAEAAQRGDASIRLHGGDQTRDPLFIDDAVEAFMCAAARIPELAGKPIVIGGREEMSVRDIASLILEVCGSNAAVVMDQGAMRPGEMLRSTCDLAEAASLLNWAPRISLREGLERTFGSRSPGQRVAAS